MKWYSRVSTLLILLGFSSTSTAATYYVSLAGSDANIGSESQPFRNIQKAASVVNPGDTVIVENGTYANSGSDVVVNVTRGGNSKSNMVTFKARNKWGAVIDGAGREHAAGFKINANFVRIEGFEIRNIYRDVGGSSAIDGGYKFASGNDSEYIRNNIHHIGRICTDTTNGEVGIYFWAHRVIVDGNMFHDIGRLAKDENGCNPATAYYKNHDHGVYHEAGDDVTIKNNIFYNINRGWAIQAYPKPRARLKILNNTFKGPHPYQTSSMITFWETVVTDSVIENNIFYDPTTYVFDFTRIAATNLRIANNIVYSGTFSSGTPAGVTFSNNRLNTDPLMVAPASFDFHLQSTSPAINTGVYEGTLVPNDFDGNLRPSGAAYDIGAYEFVSAPTPTVPAAPSGLVATAVSSSQINLVFSDNSSNESNFEVERSSGGSAYVKVATLGAGVTSHSDSGLAASTNYSYRVRAINAAGASGYSNVSSATTSAVTPTPTAPSAPSNLALSVISSSQINLSFSDNSSNEVNFEVERSVSGGAFTRIATLGANVTSHSDPGLSPSTAYAYRVRAINAAGASGYSNTVNATTPAAPVTSTNLVKNPGFEEGGLNWEDWGNSIVVTGSPHSGVNSLRTGTGEGGRGQSISGVIAGSSYTFSAWGRRSAAGSDYCQVAVEFRNSSGVTISTVRKDVTATAWTQYSSTLTTPSSFSSVYVWVYKDPGSAYCFVDDFSLTKN
jgi:hypothetical protein